MEAKDLEIFNQMPFLFWVKDEAGTYLWGNKTISELAGENVVGKKDSDMIWAENAEALRADDRRVFDTGQPLFMREYVHKSSRGNATLNACKWLGELDGQKRCFGISFVID